MTNKMKTIKIRDKTFNIIGAKNNKDILEFKKLMSIILKKK